LSIFVVSGMSVAIFRNLNCSLDLKSFDAIPPHLYLNPSLSQMRLNHHVNLIQLSSDLGAERLIAAERKPEKIAV
jgi:hypothetical protein